LAEDATPDYQELFDAVQRYQKGDSESALKVLEDWKDFLEGFVLLLRGGPVNRLTRSHRILLSNFVKNSGLARSLKSKHPVTAAFLAAESALTTVSIQLRPIETEDLRQEVIEVFLATLRRYRSRDNQNYLIPYIQVSFPYAMTRRVQQLVKDPLVNLASDKILSIEAMNPEAGSDRHGMSPKIQSKEVVAFLTSTYEDALHDLEEEELGISWIRGDSCHEVFDVLTPIERRILRCYSREMTDSQIAFELGVSYNTAIRRRHLIISKVRGEYRPPTCQYCETQIPKAPLGRQPRQCIGCKDERRAERVSRRRKAHERGDD
jgi:hypothetical protein